MASAFMSNTASAAATIFATAELAESAIGVHRSYSPGCTYKVLPHGAGGFRVAVRDQRGEFLEWL